MTRPFSSAIGPEQMHIDDDLRRLIDEHLPFVRSLHARGSLAPVAVSMKMNGVITGHALVMESREAREVSVDYALRRFTDQFQQAFHDRRIRAAAIFFHGSAVGTTIRPALSVDQANTLVVWLDNISGDSFQATIPYANLDSGRWEIAHRPAF